MQKEEMTTMSFSFGPDNRYVLHIPLSRDELTKSLQRFAQALTGATICATAKTLPDEYKSPRLEPKQLTPEQLTFNWGEPICGNSEKIPL